MINNSNNNCQSEIINELYSISNNTPEEILQEIEEKNIDKEKEILQEIEEKNIDKEKEILQEIEEENIDKEKEILQEIVENEEENIDKEKEFLQEIVENEEENIDKEKEILQEIEEKKEENIVKKKEDKIITKENINILLEYINKKKKIVVLGPGPTFQKIEPNDDNLIICVNSTIMVQHECDIFVFGDKVVLEEYLNPELLKNIKFLLFCLPLHDYGPQFDYLNIEYVINKTYPHFDGYFIPFTMNYNDYNDDNDDNYINLPLNYYTKLGINSLPYPESNIMIILFLYKILFSFDVLLEKNVSINTKYNINFYGFMNNSDNLFTDEYDFRPYNKEIFDAFKKLPSFKALMNFRKNAKDWYKNNYLLFKNTIYGILEYYSHVIDYKIN